MKEFFLILWAFSISPHIYSQLTFVNYKNSGQYNDAFTAITFDKNNLPWTGTILNGIHYFNGRSFKNFSTLNSELAHNKIYDLLYSNDDQLWIASLGGLSLLKNNTWINYTTENSNLPSNAVLCLAKGIGGRIWIGTDNGAVDGIMGKVYNKGNSAFKGELIFHIFVDSKGNRWFCTDQEVAKYDGENWEIFNSENSNLPAEIALFMAEDANGLIWLSMGNTYDGTLAAFNGESWKIYDENILYNLTSRISSIISFADGTTWFGTHDKGLIRHKDSVWTGYTTDNSDIPINQIICMKADRENNLWLGHRNGLTKVQTNVVMIREQIFNNGFRVIPNPIEHKAKLIFPGEVGKKTYLKVVNTSGQLVFYTNNIDDNFVFEKKNCSPGVYFIELFYNGARHRKKVIIK